MSVCAFRRLDFPVFEFQGHGQTIRPVVTRPAAGGSGKLDDWNCMAELICPAHTTIALEWRPVTGFVFIAGIVRPTHLTNLVGISTSAYAKIGRASCRERMEIWRGA